MSVFSLVVVYVLGVAVAVCGACSVFSECGASSVFGCGASFVFFECGANSVFSVVSCFSVLFVFVAVVCSCVSSLCIS